MVNLPKSPQSMLQNPNGNKPSQVFIKTWEGKINWEALNKGVTVVEILIVVFILSVAFTGILGLLVFSLQTLNLIEETTYANFLAQETIEAVRNFRDGTDWSVDGLGTLPTGDTNPHHPGKTGDVPPKWTLVSGEETVNNFTRKIVFESVQRVTGSDDIFEGTGVPYSDPDTRKATVTVSWKDKKVEVITYFTNWQ